MVVFGYFENQPPEKLSTAEGRLDPQEPKNDTCMNYVISKCKKSFHNTMLSILLLELMVTAFGGVALLAVFIGDAPAQLIRSIADAFVFIAFSFVYLSIASIFLASDLHVVALNKFVFFVGEPEIRASYSRSKNTNFAKIIIQECGILEIIILSFLSLPIFNLFASQLGLRCELLVLDQREISNARVAQFISVLLIFVMLCIIDYFGRIKKYLAYYKIQRKNGVSSFISMLGLICWGSEYFALGNLLFITKLWIFAWYTTIISIRLGVITETVLGLLHKKSKTQSDQRDPEVKNAMQNSEA